MGPEPLSLRGDQLAKRLTKTTRAIKNVLLDQSVIAGLGNIYVDESLFKAGIHPLAAADRLSIGQIMQLNRAIKFTLRKALRHRGSSAAGLLRRQRQSRRFSKAACGVRPSRAAVPKMPNTDRANCAGRAIDPFLPKLPTKPLNMGISADSRSENWRFVLYNCFDSTSGTKLGSTQML